MIDTVIRSVPLDRLELSPANVRRTEAGKSAFAELKASIAAHGLLKNLVVRAIRPDESGAERYAVIAGGRRLAALADLAAEDVLAGDFPVPCRIIENGAADNELSLAENVVHAAMHPADQVEAFGALAGDGTTVADIAARFGVSERIVEQRLRLGNAAPELLDAYRAGEIDLETLKSFAVTADPPVSILRLAFASANALSIRSRFAGVAPHLSPFDNSFACAFASTSRRPFRPETPQVLAISQFGVRDLPAPSASHHSLNCRRIDSGSSTAPPSAALSNCASRTSDVPCGRHRSPGETTTSGLQTIRVSRSATRSGLPSVRRTQRGRLPRVSFPNSFNQPIRSSCFSRSRSRIFHPSRTKRYQALVNS